MTRRVFLCAVLLFVFWTASSQDSTIDSLLSVVSRQKNDSSKVLNLISVSTAYLDSDISKVFLYANGARTVAKEINFRKGTAMAFKCMGQGYMVQGLFSQALLQFQRSLEIYDSIGFKPGIGNILSNIGAVYFNTGDDAKAIDYYLRSLRVSEEIHDDLRIGTAYNNIGGVYNNKKATVDKGLEYFKMALPIFQRIDYPDGVATVAMNIGEIYQDKKLYDSAVYYFNASLRIYEGSVDATFPLTHLGQIYADQGKFDRALQYHEEAIAISEKLDAKYELTQSLLGLAETQVKQGKTTLAIPSYRKARQIAETINARNELETVYQALATLYARQGDFKQAFSYEVLFTGIKDSLYNSSSDKKIQQLQFNFDIDKKEAEIDLLTKDKALKDATIQRQKVLNYAAAITGFLLLIVAVGSYNRYKFVRKTNKIIKEERDRSKELLLNILPEETARELETDGYARTRYYESVTVLFTDFKGFSTIAGHMAPQDLVAELNDYFVAFDEIVGRYNLEKIKTIGDAYMCAGGIPSVNETHPVDAVRAALAMQTFILKKSAERREKGLEVWELRVGIHTGSIVAGVVGKKKYAYDIWGDTVNIASRMESNGEPGKVNISSATYQLVKDQFACFHRGKLSAKNIGEVDMYFVSEEIHAPHQGV